MNSSKEVQWTRFGVAVWVIGITVLIIGFALSQDRVYVEHECVEYWGTECTHWLDVHQYRMTTLAVVGYLFAAFGILLIFSGFVVYFVLTSRSKARAAAAEAQQKDAPPDERRPES